MHSLTRMCSNGLYPNATHGLVLNKNSTNYSHVGKQTKPDFRDVLRVTSSRAVTFSTKGDLQMGIFFSVSPNTQKKWETPEYICPCVYMYVCMYVLVVTLKAAENICS